MNQWAIIWSARDSFIAGLIATLELFILAAVVGLAIGIVLCYLTEYQKRWLNRVIIGQPDARDSVLNPRLSALLRPAGSGDQYGRLECRPGGADDLPRRLFL